VDDYEVSYTYAKATGGRNTIRRTGLTLPDGTSVTYIYRDSNRLDADASRVTQVRVGSTTVADYSYNGVGQVVGINYPEPDVMAEQFGSTSGSYPDLDRFNRVTSSRWTKDLATDQDFYDLDISYDRNSNITLAEDNVHAGFDVEYTIDNLNRLRQAEEGTWNGSSITSRTRQQIWEDTSSNLGLDLVGNWDDVLLDLDGDGVFTGTDEYKDDRTHNDGNELTGRDTDDSGSDDFTLTHDQVGNLTDDGEHYEYEYDAFGRLRKVKDTGDQSLVAEYTYNGLGYRIGWHYDVDADGTVESTSDDPWYYFAYDDRWRITATFRTDDSDPKEQFVYHNAGNDGRGPSSYIDTVILRDKDANTSWDTESDGTLEERIYYCHNWRSDVVALVTDTGAQVEQVRYSAYGVPFGLRAGDVDSDGDVDSADTNQIQTWIDASAYDVRGDLDLDGDVDTTDKSTANNNLGKFGWGVLSDVGNRKGDAGYELDDALADAYRLYHVRRRVLNADLGRWTRRDPLGYAVGPNLYAYVSANPLVGVDPCGTCPEGDPCNVLYFFCSASLDRLLMVGQDCEPPFTPDVCLILSPLPNGQNKYDPCRNFGTTCRCVDLVPEPPDMYYCLPSEPSQEIVEIISNGCLFIYTFSVTTQICWKEGICHKVPSTQFPFPPSHRRTDPLAPPPPPTRAT
jgi:RHS repeat-associated protein